jgi:hypothetical protein
MLGAVSIRPSIERMPERVSGREWPQLSGRRVVLLTGGHLSTCPSMVKAADALAERGCDVRVVSVALTSGRREADEALVARRHWRWCFVDCTPEEAAAAYRRTGLRRRASLAATRMLGSRAPMPVALRAYSRAHDELVAAALAEPADLFYGGTTGALAAAAESGERAGVPYALDLEDFHPAEQGGPDGLVMNRVASRLLARIGPAAAFVTTAGSAMAAEYAAVLGRTLVVVDNTSPLPATPPPFEERREDPLRFYWFSQTIGPGRGLEEVVRAIGVAGIPADLFVRGHDASRYVEVLQRIAEGEAPRVSVRTLPLVEPDALIAASRGFDIGLAVECGVPRNNALALSNKALTYPLAGLALVMTDTPGQRVLADDLGHAAIRYAPGHPQDLVSGLRRWHRNRGDLAEAKRQTWERARLRWHWECRDRQAIVDAVAEVFA